jgi:hypothetical protein
MDADTTGLPKTLQQEHDSLNYRHNNRAFSDQQPPTIPNRSFYRPNMSVVDARFSVVVL